MKQNIIASLFAASLFVIGSGASAQTATATGTGTGIAGATAQVQANPAATAGAYNGGSSSGIQQSFSTYSKSQVPIALPNPYGAAAGSPALFQLFDRNPTVAGITPTLVFEALCGSAVYTASNAGVMIEAVGKSGKTNVQFAARPEYVQANGVPVTTVSTSIPEGTKVVCGGILQIDATKPNTSMGIILNDGRTFPLGNFRGHRHAYVVTVPEALAAALGVDTEGDGYSFGASGGGSGNPLSLLLGLFGSKSGVSGATKPAAFAGGTMYVFFAPETPDEPGIVFQPKSVVQPVPQPPVAEVKPSAAVAPQPVVSAKPSVATPVAPSSIDDATRARALDLARKSAIK